jgi:HD-GYP domain-containing protein (c-di-GMP phosphodiesterase class II)
VREGVVLELQAAVARTLVASVAARDAYTGEHSQAVVAQSAAIAKYLGLSDQQVADIKQAEIRDGIATQFCPTAANALRQLLTNT